VLAAVTVAGYRRSARTYLRDWAARPIGEVARQMVLHAHQRISEENGAVTTNNCALTRSVDLPDGAVFPSPVVVNGFLIVPDDRGTVNCFAAATGERLWQERLGPHFSTSLVTAGGLVYLIADDGRTKVIRPGSKLEVVARGPVCTGRCG
jgi:hypothetical protein